jgi:putative colanic acid biosynthesis acetyltransferase WcaF
MLINLDDSRTQWPLPILIRRALWSCILQPLVRFLPKQLSFLRIAALRMMGARVGPRCLILPGVRILMPWNLELSDHVALGEGVNVYNYAPVRIGRMTVVSQFCFICTGSHDYLSSDMRLTWAPIVIGEQCWIAAQVFLAPGVQVANGVVIGARSVVTKSIREVWSVHAGNPCIRIKKRVMATESCSSFVNESILK